MKKKIYIGTSGWSYKHWDEVFYPEYVKENERLKFYGAQFNTVEINTTFYHLPKEKAVKNWRESVSSDFIFSVKASRYITHVKRLKDPQEGLLHFYQAIRFLKEKTGPILFQLPPSFEKDLVRFTSFLKELKKKFRYTFEFRNKSWFCDEVYEELYKHNCALCISDLDGYLSPLEVTSDFVYLRLHGPRLAYKGAYGKRRLLTWKKRIKAWNETGKDVYCYFDNDEKSYAIQDAHMLNELLL